jgi:8-oxo-dGTP diphosphatase
MPPERYTSIVDVHMLLRRDGKILLLRRAGDVWASGQLCLPSVHLASLLSELLLSDLLLAV